MGRSLLLALPLVLSLAVAGTLHAEEIDCVTTEWKLLGANHKVCVNAFDDPERGQKAAAVLALVGVVNVPIIKFSVDWWNTLHQPASVVKMGGPAIDSTMMVPLILMAVAFKAYYVVVLILRTRAEIAGQKLRVIRMAQVHAAGRAEIQA